MSSAGQSLITSLSNISNCSGHQCNCCDELSAKITNLQAEIHLVNERCGVIEHLLDDTATKVEHLQEQIDLLIAIDLGAALFALVMPEILAAAGHSY
ncbi:MAG: hypothetical protein V7K94_25640 [Nostoc sp.]|uniref:hypothetical protein n=1 Tax=Nostoc sp. TaxID=1180 RepID=UPI002FFA75C6